MDHPRRRNLLAAERVRLIGIAGSGLLLIMAAALPWWSVNSMAPPESVFLSRCLAAVFGLVALVGLFWKGLRAHLSYLSFLFAAIPIILLLQLTLKDENAAYWAIKSKNEGLRIIRMIEHTDRLSQVPYLRDRPMRTDAVLQNDYSFYDGMETSLLYSKVGFYAFFVGVIGLGTCAYRYRNRRSAKRVAYSYLAIGLPVILFYAGPELYADLLVSKGRTLAAEGSTHEAISYLQHATEYAPRLKFDMRYVYDLGTLSVQDGDGENPYALMALADVYSSNSLAAAYLIAWYGELEQSANIYRANWRILKNLQAAKIKFCQVLLAKGCVDATLGDYQTARNSFDEALRVDPSNLEARFLRAYSDLSLDDWGTARNDFIDTIRENNSPGISFFTYDGQLYYRRPISAIAWRSLAYCYYQCGDQNTAVLCKFNATLIKAPSPDSLPELKQ